MKEYYVLLLNNCYDKGIHWLSAKPFSMLPNVLEKDINDLYLTENAFMDLDNTIIINDNGYHVLGSFPVFGEILDDGKMHDVITGKIITKASVSKEANGLSYNTKYKVDSKMAEEVLTLINDEEKERYTKSLENLETYSRKVFHSAEEAEKYYILRPINMSINAIPVIAKEMNGQLIDMITKEKISLTSIPNSISSNLSVRGVHYEQYKISKEQASNYLMMIIDFGVEKYIKNVNNAKTNSIRTYNNFKSLAKDDIKVRTR